MEMRRRPGILFYVVTALVLALDQGTKLWARTSLEPVRNVALIPGWLDFTFVRNTGIAFGMFAGKGWLVAIFMVALVGVAVWYAGGLNWRRREPNLVAGLLVGGAAGNILDRARLGYVVDFIDAHAGMHHWPTFNVADSMICLAVGWIVLRQLRAN
jgi:signal peptidase II